jgi:hypothetical protein
MPVEAVAAAAVQLLPPSSVQTQSSARYKAEVLSK